MVWGRLHAERLLKKNENNLAQSFNFTFRYMDVVLSMHNSKLGDYVDRIYYTELEIKDITDTARDASYLDLHLEIDIKGWFRMTPYDKRDYFNSHIRNFSFICSNIQAPPVYGVLSQNNSMFRDSVNHIYSTELTTETSRSASNRFWTIYSYEAIFQKHIHMECIYLSWYKTADLVVSVVMYVAANKTSTDPRVPSGNI